MAQISQITLADGQATPANHIFKPFLPQQGSTPAEWRNRETDTTVGDRKITIRLSENTNKYNVSIRIADPVLSAIPTDCCTPLNVPAVAYTDFVNIEFSIAKSATLSNRKDILAYAKNLLASTVVQSAVHDLEVIW